MSGRPKDSGSHENISAALGLFLETTSHAILPELLLKRAAECHFPLQEMQVTGPKKKRVRPVGSGSASPHQLRCGFRTHRPHENPDADTSILKTAQFSQAADTIIMPQAQRPTMPAF